MKSPGEQKQEISTTTSVNNTSNLSIKRTSYLFNHISKLAAGHDVRVSGTMIKVTYKKALKEGFISSTCFNVNTSDEDSGLDDTSMSNSINALNVCFNQDRATKTVMNKKSVCDSESSAVPRIKTSTCVIKGSEQPIFHSTPKVDIDITERKKREYINGLNLLVKLENENSKSKVPTNNFHFKPSIAMNSHNTATSHSVLSSKSVQIKASTSDKFQSNSIKIPKGITIIKVKGNINSKNDKVQKSVEDIKLKPKIKKTSSENNLVIKDIKKHKIDLKRRIKIGEGVVANKIRKSETNNQCVKKKFKKTKEVSRKISSPSETLRKKKLIDENSEIIAGRSSKKELLKEDPDLPPGWKRVVLTRYEGTPFEKHVVYIYSPQGKKFQFKWKLRRYLERTKSTLSAEQFHFGLYKRAKSSLVPPVIERKQENLNFNKKTVFTKDKSQPTSNSSKTILLSKGKGFNIKGSNVVSSSQTKKRLNQCKEKTDLKNVKQAQSSGSDVNVSENTANADKRQLLLFDPDLPFGWKRIINSNNSSGKLQVHIISPEGRIFRRRYRLNEYLTKHQYTHSLDRFYFGLYPKKDSINPDGDNSKMNEMNTTEASLPNGRHGYVNSGDVKVNPEGEEGDEDGDSSDKDDDSEELLLSELDMSKFNQYNTPMYDDPNLPEGWKRFIKIRSCGKSAGRMEVVVVSPDGKRHRSKGQLERYLQRNDLSYDANDFDFSVFGRTKKRSQPLELKESKESNLINNFKRRSKPTLPNNRPVPDLDISELKDIKFTPEGEMINAVNGLMIACELSSGRSERRLRLPRSEHEKILRDYLNSESDINYDDCNISPYWIQRLVKCRSDFRSLEPDAASMIAQKTKEFLMALSLRAFQDSKNSDAGLQYDDVANVVDKYECLSSLKTIIPKKITYKEYIKFNRPKQFMSFT